MANTSAFKEIIEKRDLLFVLTLSTTGRLANMKRKSCLKLKSFNKKLYELRFILVLLEKSTLIDFFSLLIYQLRPIPLRFCEANFCYACSHHINIHVHFYYMFARNHHNCNYIYSNFNYALSNLDYPGFCLHKELIFKLYYLLHFLSQNYIGCKKW